MLLASQLSYLYNVPMRKPPKKRNPIARAVRRIRPKVKPSKKVYKRERYGLHRSD